MDEYSWKDDDRKAVNDLDPQINWVRRCWDVQVQKLEERIAELEKENEKLEEHIEELESSKVSKKYRALRARWDAAKELFYDFED